MTQTYTVVTISQTSDHYTTCISCQSNKTEYTEEQLKQYLFKHLDLKKSLKKRFMEQSLTDMIRDVHDTYNQGGMTTQILMIIDDTTHEILFYRDIYMSSL